MKGVEGVQISYLGDRIPLSLYPSPSQNPLKIEKIMKF